MFLSRYLLILWLLGTAHAQTYNNPVIPGDHPDPSIIRVGNDYWATSTTSQWAPIFPLLHSTNLVDWQAQGAVFATPPAWSAGNYWAPEISEYRGAYFVYYAARKKDGPMCVAVATAANPQGPYADHGPLVCEDVGSIDPAPVTDENGNRYLIWKKDGNSQKQPTPLMAQQLSDDGTQLVGERRELIRNDKSWEGQLVEGPYVLRRDGWFYLFYSGAGCCGVRCDYKLGVARSKALLGPYEKNPSNPIMIENNTWLCPGHGSIVTDPQGRTFLLYHAYDAKDFIYTGRQALVDEVKWNADGWPQINGGSGPSVTAASPYHRRQNNNRFDFVDDFRASALGPDWEWPWRRKPEITLDPSAGGWLTLIVPPGTTDERIAAVVAQYPRRGDYTASTRVDAASLSAGAWAGLTAYGDDKNALGIAVSKDQVLIWRRKDGSEKTTGSVASSGPIHLRMDVSGGKNFHFAFSRDGRTWTDIQEQLGGEYLPPWDLAVRIALTAGGVPGASARFDYLRITAARSPRHAKLVNQLKP